MSELLLRAELQKLAVVLRVSVAELAFLSHLDPPSLRALRQAISASLFDRHAKRFRRLADSTKLLPNKVVAVICEKVIPASVAAQVTGLLDPKDAVDLASRLSVPYQADICVAIDPRRAVSVLHAMPSAHVVAVAVELQKRREFMTMAVFVDALTEQQIRRVAARMDIQSLLHVGFFVESAERLDQLITLLDTEQLRGTMSAAAADDGALWPQVLSMVERLSPPQRARLGSLLADAPPLVLASLNEALFERDLWRLALPMLEAMDAAAQEIVVASLASHAEQAAEAHPHLEALLESMSEGLRRQVLIALGRA